MSDTLGVREYAEHLADLHVFLRSFEDALLDQQPELSARFSYDLRLKAPLIAKDLQTLGHPMPAIRPNISWRIDPAERALGFLYVLEGATLGGKFVSRHVEKTAGVSPEATHYFRSYGSNRGKRWKEFKELAQEYVDQHVLDSDEVVEAAKEMFERLEGWMNHGVVSQPTEERVTTYR